MPGMALELLLARQAGVISREQALRCGLSAATVDRLVRTRRWRPLHPRVYLVPGYGSGGEVRARAAVLWAGGGAVLSGAAAAWWHGLLPDPLPTLAVTTPARRPARPGVAVRCELLDAADRTERRGLPVTALGLTALGAAIELGGPPGERLLHRVLQEIGWVEVLAAHRRNPTLAGSALLAAVTRGRDLHHLGARIRPSTGVSR
jgi:putative AbiEi antitoxin of type IV toxin-antitoxin system